MQEVRLGKLAMLKKYSFEQRVFLFAFVLVIYVLPQYLVAKETIQWLWFEQAPYFIGKSPRVGKGVGDELTRYYQDNLPEYEHQNIRVNAIRYNSMIKKDNVCVPVAWLTDNERHYLIQTRPHALEPPAGIYIHKRKQRQFGAQGNVLSMRKLLKNKQLKLGALRGMEYSKDADQLLTLYEGHQNLILIDAPMVEISLGLLRLQRLDYLLGLPVQRKTLIDTASADSYLFYNVREITKYLPMYSHCSKSITGREIIQKLNELLTTNRLMESIEHYESWYDGDESFRKIFLDYIVHGISHPLVTDM